MRLSKIAAMSFLVVACTREEAAPPAPVAKPRVEQVTTTAPPTKIEGKKEFAVAFAQPDLLAGLVIGRLSGTSVQPAQEMKRSEPVGFDITLKSVPDGLAATIDVFDADEKKVFTQRKVVPRNEKKVLLTWLGPNKKGGEYTVKLFLGGDQYAEETLKISE